MLAKGELIWSNSLNVFQGKSLRVLIEYSICMYGEVKNIEKRFYFTRKDGVFEVSKIVFISDCRRIFLPETF